MTKCIFSEKELKKSVDIDSSRAIGLIKKKCKALFILDDYAYQWIYGDTVQEEISKRVDLIENHKTANEIRKHPELLKDVEVIFSGWGSPCFDEILLNSAPKLKAIFYGAGSVRCVVSEALWSRCITVVSAYAMNAVPVAEFTTGVILLSLKGVWHYTSEMKRLKANPETILFPGGYRSKIGLISYGMIARNLRENLRAYDLDILVYDPFLTPQEAQAKQVQLSSLDGIFQSCDVISLHTPLLKETEGMIRGRHFDLMKPRATFINTARGLIVKEAEMTEVLKKRNDITAFLDLTDPAPPVKESLLYALPNVILTPHIAGALGAECRRMGKLMIEEFDRWYSGDSLRWQITKSQLQTSA